VDKFILFWFFRVRFVCQQKPNVYECAVGFLFSFSCSKFIILVSFVLLVGNGGNMKMLGILEHQIFGLPHISLIANSFVFTTFCPIFYIACYQAYFLHPVRWGGHTLWQVLVCVVGFSSDLPMCMTAKGWLQFFNVVKINLFSAFKLLSSTILKPLTFLIIVIKSSTINLYSYFSLIFNGSNFSL
jgi:hypothetical protein